MLTLNYGSIIKALLLRLCYYGSIKALSSRLYEGSIKAPLGSIKALAPLGLYAGTIKERLNKKNSRGAHAAGHARDHSIIKALLRPIFKALLRPITRLF